MCRHNEEGIHIAVSYNGLAKLLIDKNMKKVDAMINQGGNQQQVPWQNDQWRAGFHEGSGKDLREVRFSDFGDIVHYEKETKDGGQ